jgi:hypothetical protein
VRPRALQTPLEFASIRNTTDAGRDRRFRLDRPQEDPSVMRTLTSAWWAPIAAAAIVLATPAAFAQRRVPVNVDSVPQGATVRLDSDSAAPIGTTPLHRTRIPAGAHTLYITHDGFLPGRLDITVGRRNETFTSTLIQGGSIYVSADIDGAQILMDGNPVGTTPGRINNVQPGQHMIELRQQGMDPHRESVTVGAGAVASVNATLRPPAPQAPPTGTVRVIVTNPNGALPGDLAVTFDGSPMTGTPPSTDQAGPGTHIVQVSAANFRTIRREVQVVAGQTYALAVDLDAIAQTPTGGTVRVIVPTHGAQVYLDGELLAGSPPARDNVPAGTHALRITATGRQDVLREIQVAAGQVDVEQVPDLAAASQAGRINVHSATPGAQVFIDGRSMGPSPYQRDDMPAGNYHIVVRAQGFDDGTAQCTVAANTPCDIDVPLTHSLGHGTIHVELNRAIPSAVAIMDGQTVGNIGAGMDIPNVTAQTHEVRVHADGFDDFVQTITLAPNQTLPIMAQMHRLRRGPTGAELAQRRSAISTWGANPLSRGDIALDVFLSYGSYPLEARFTTGIVGNGLFGLDAGVGLRTMGFFHEVEARIRPGLRFLDGLLAVGLDVRGFLGLSNAGTGNYGACGYGVFSIHSLAPPPDEGGDDDESGQRERSNQAGSFAFSAHFGFEAFNDGLKGLIWRGNNEPGTGARFSACNPQPMAMMGATMAPNLDPPTTSTGCTNLTTMSTTSATPDIVVNTGTELLVRPIGGLALEVGLGRHLNLVAAIDRIFGGTSEYLGMSNFPNARAIYQGFWFGTDSFTYIHAGITYKF